MSPATDETAFIINIKFTYVIRNVQNIGDQGVKGVMEVKYIK